ncbi:hypothetical protein SDRG_10253 [Saprolegnia diclina VS20]|uniref:Uncharacterized protein n=1 Tax=Saprolegnia diclina (strain VS20) TaxID=1156394 RepID=T0QEQ4_SAPDV|nr:hypothetical protein SDRG_10253 [Saprolegnia diclina VS20]EQC32055.1 hypothetical protein SDRG_10253 [Saprolegnia diclina VS20]|eukprot:XP_008614457.1 hypothetical protein SDRG_10253 [Saprolegnia diclina VS20]
MLRLLLGALLLCSAVAHERRLVGFMPKAHCPGTCPTVHYERRQDCSRCRVHQFMPSTAAPLRRKASFMPRWSTLEMETADAGLEPATPPSTAAPATQASRTSSAGATPASTATHPNEDGVARPATPVMQTPSPSTKVPSAASTSDVSGSSSDGRDPASASHHGSHSSSNSASEVRRPGSDRVDHVIVVPHPSSSLRPEHADDRAAASPTPMASSATRPEAFLSSGSIAAIVAGGLILVLLLGVCVWMRSHDSDASGAYVRSIPADSDESEGDYVAM